MLLLSVLRGRPSLNRCLICFSGTYSRYLFDIRYKDLAITDLAGTRDVDDGLENAIHQFLENDYFDFYFWQKIYDVFGAAIELGMAFCLPKPLTSVTVSPVMPISLSASHTSSSLKGLMIASIFFTVRSFEQIFMETGIAVMLQAVRLLPLNLTPVVGRGEVYGFWGAGQGATTRNGRSIPRSCNAAMCRKNCAIHLVAPLTRKMSVK